MGEGSGRAARGKELCPIPVKDEDKPEDPQTESLDEDDEEPSEAESDT